MSDLRDIKDKSKELDFSDLRDLGRKFILFAAEIFSREY